MYAKYLKRPLDFVLSLLAIIVLLPVILLVALLVRLKLGSPVIFRQQRPGKEEKIFELYKFRTMTDATDSAGNLLSDEERITSFGKMLRSTSLDELPELINIIKGDMSIVGPRPLLVKYLSRYNAQQRRRHEVRPGFTGYAQASGRNGIGWDKKFELDTYYVDHITFWGDVKIILKTALIVLRRDGIHSSASETMEEFMGSESRPKISIR